MVALRLPHAARLGVDPHAKGLGLTRSGHGQSFVHRLFRIGLPSAATRRTAVGARKSDSSEQNGRQSVSMPRSDADLTPLMHTDSYCEYFSSTPAEPYIFDGVVHGPPGDLRSAWRHFLSIGGKSVWRWEGTVLPYVWLPASLAVAYALAVELMWQAGLVPAAANDGLNAIVTLLSLLTAFRLSISYSRFWEGRSEWAKITGCVSDIACKASVLITGDHLPDGETLAVNAKAELARLLRIQVGAMVVTMQTKSEKARAKRYGIKPQKPWQGLEGTPALFQDADDQELLELLEEKNDPPLLAISWLRRHLYQMQRDGLLGPSDFGSFGFLQSFDTQICEMWPRNAAIKLCSTPFPVVYLHMMRLLRQCVLLYMPVALVDDLSWDMVAVVGIMAVGLYGLDEVSTQLEEPFAVADLDDFLTVNSITSCFSKINKFLDPAMLCPNLMDNIVKDDPTTEF